MRPILFLLILIVSRPVFGCDPDRVQSADPASELNQTMASSSTAPAVRV